jgi:hypothetical protein
MYLQIFHAMTAKKRDDFRRRFPGAMPGFVGFDRLRLVDEIQREAMPMRHEISLNSVCMMSGYAVLLSRLAPFAAGFPFPGAAANHGPRLVVFFIISVIVSDISYHHQTDYA